MTGRSVPEWHGSTPDAKIPPRVSLRIWERHKGVCYLTGRKIGAGDTWDLDHITALCNGGEHRESNLAPVLRDAHKVKTRADVAAKAKVDRIRKVNLGLKRSSNPLPCGRKSPWKKRMDGTVLPR